MGADFNILEYADPELDTIAGGEKTNILDLDLEQVEVEPKEEKQKKETKDEEQKPDHLPTGSAEMTDTCSTSTTLTTLTEGTNVPSITPSQPASQPNPTAMQAQVVQQQMHQHVQQAAAMGRPMPPGTRLLSPDGAVGVVTSTNTVTVSYPSSFPGHPQRISPAHIQGNLIKLTAIIIDMYVNLGTKIKRSVHSRGSSSCKDSLKTNRS